MSLTHSINNTLICMLCWQQPHPDRVNDRTIATFDRDHYSHSSSSSPPERDLCHEEKNHYLDGQGLGMYDQGQGLGDTDPGVIPPAPSVPARPLPGMTTRPRALSSSTTATAASSFSSTPATIPKVLPSSNNNKTFEPHYAESPNGTVVSSSGSTTS